MNVALAEDKMMVKEDSFTTHLIPSLKTTLFTHLEAGRRVPNTLFGLIPFEVTYALKNVARVASSTRFHFLRFILGILLMRSQGA
jgi:hypothetical protein